MTFGIGGRRADGIGEAGVAAGNVTVTPALTAASLNSFVASSAVTSGKGLGRRIRSARPHGRR